ncbi:DUF2953 domain-containing protein [Pelosinus propionicus]|uniref:DUF2953 domain-containing protein n=1 Tax=Pelosinus propionicus DSM 13327 TaxID=1123291 RepID=A0A1I4KQP3_9FIRM|nr:DUF2953 domain-containing protein [Pelosinus propionicus]SFL80777.1 Protein of unknown function [Pelosinus propionicus DSM 13327]
MEFGLTFIVATLIIIFLISLSKIYIEVEYKRNNENDYVAVNVYALKKLIFYTMQVPILRVVEKSGEYKLESTVRTAVSQEKLDPLRDEKRIKKTDQLVKEHPQKIRHTIQKFHHYTKHYCKIIEELLKLVVCEKLCWRTKFGSEDAALTGTFVGVLWFFKTLLTNHLKRKIFSIGTLDIEVNPFFGSDQLEIEFQCIFSIRLGNVIKAFRSIYNIK